MDLEIRSKKFFNNKKSNIIYNKKLSNLLNLKKGVSKI